MSQNNHPDRIEHSSQWLTASEEQLKIIEESCLWIKNSLPPEKRDNANRNLVNYRREVKKKKRALEAKPAAAVYGESQVGKSYLLSSLLSEQGKPFHIQCNHPVDGKDAAENNEVTYNFVNDVNPRGEGSESTGLVTRFSVGYKPAYPAFPIKAVLLSPADIILILCDSYYNDLKFTVDLGSQDDRIKQIKAEIETLKNEYDPQPLQQTVLIGEDEIMDIRDYFADFFNEKATALLSSGFFDEIALIISKVKPSEWVNIFSLLWHKNEYFSNIFIVLIKELKRLNFCDTVYLPVKSVLNKYVSLLDVKLIHQVFNNQEDDNADFCNNTDILYILNNEAKYVNLKKSYICALSAEVVFSLPETLTKSKSFLNETDLLDFPGSRSRMELEEKFIAENISGLFLRGKVAYLFNKYANAEKINLLLFCAKHTQAANFAIPVLLNKWICKTVGNNPEERELFTKELKVPPLFLISTFFNINLQYDPQHDKLGELKPLIDRWEQRFETTLEKEYIGSAGNKTWFNNWTKSNLYFQNIYLLRDFAKSESVSNIFKGYKDSQQELEEIQVEDYPGFRRILRDSFINYQFVKCHFFDPEGAWDGSACINQDGSALIIENLTIASEHINMVRSEKISKELKEIKRNVLCELEKHYHSSTPDKNLQKAKSMAGDMQLKLDAAFVKNPYFFGLMINELMIDEYTVYNWFIDKKHYHSNENNYDMYSIIRMNVSTLDSNASFDENLEQLRRHYRKNSKEECQTFFEAEGINLMELFYGSNKTVMTFPQRLAKNLETYWFEQLSVENKKSLKNFLPESNLLDLFEMLQKLFSKLKVSDEIANYIADNMIDDNINENAYEMIADYSAEIINEFINSAGYKFLSESDFDALKIANQNQENDLRLVLNHSHLIVEDKNRMDAAVMIANRLKTIDILPSLRNIDLENAVKSLPHYREYKLWYDRINTGFIYVCNIPNYNVEANEKLKAIIDHYNTINYIDYENNGSGKNDIMPY